MIQVCRKYPTKLLFIVAVLFSLGVSIFAPTTVLAQIDEESSLSTQNSDLVFCKQLNSISTRINSEVDIKINTINDSIRNREAKINETFNKYDTEISKSREKWDKNRSQHYEKLYERAQTDIQKQSVDQFKSNIETAITSRRMAIDNATKSYRLAIKDAISNKDNNIDIVLSNYKSIVNGALTKAQKSCESGLNVSLIRQSLRSDLQNAWLVVQSSNFNESSITNQVKLAQQTRQNSMSDAVEKFKSSIKQAEEAIKDDIK